MKLVVVALCVMLGTACAGPVTPARTSALELLTMLEDLVETEGHELITKIVHVIHKVEDGIVTLKNLVPKAYEKVHREADEVLAELKKLADEVQQLLAGKSKDVYFGFDLLGGLTELTGGAKLSTILSVLQLADKAHKVIEDARQFVPHLQDELTKIQGKIENHVDVLAKHVLKELGMEDIAHSFAKNIEDVLEEAEDEAHILILSLLVEMQNTFDKVKSELPHVYEAVKDQIAEINRESHKIISEFREIFGLNFYSILDIAGDLTKGTSLGTAIRVMNLIDKFNTVVQDIRGFGPHAETLIEHSVEKVANHAQQFFTHTAKILTKGI